MIKKTTLLLAILVASLQANSQDFGISASFFIPKNGYFSAPISPLSIRGVSLASAGPFSIDIGGSLYRMTGMSVTNVPIKSDRPAVGPFFTIMAPLEAVVTLGSGNSMVLIKGGGFVFYNFGTKLNYGNLDRAVAAHKNLDIANTRFDFSNTIGFGYEFGLEYIQYLNRQFGISLGANYYIGGSKLNMQGSVKGIDGTGKTVNETLNWQDATLDYTGFEVSVGLLFSSGRR